MADYVSKYATGAAVDAAIDKGVSAYNALDSKVDKVSGKSLSTNDYTTAEKTKLSGIEEGANKTTVDTALSSSSTNPVQNKVVNTALDNKVDKVTGKGLSTNDFSNAYKEQIDANAAGVAALANVGCKNLLPDTYADVTRSGLTFTVNVDGTIAVTGTPSSNYVDYYLIGAFSDTDVKLDFSDKNYILSFRAYDTMTGVEIPETAYIFCRIYDKSEDSSASAYVTLNASGETAFSGKITTMFFSIRSNYGTINGLTFKIMIRPASIEDNTYQPYAPTNRELYEMILALQSST